MQVTVRLPIAVADRVLRAPTILVMSEDPDWREAVCRVLGQGGYRVLAARHPGHALVEIVRSAQPLDLLLTDGDQGRRRSDFPRIFQDHPHAALLHLRSRPATRDDLLAAVTAAITGVGDGPSG